VYIIEARGREATGVRGMARALWKRAGDAVLQRVARVQAKKVQAVQEFHLRADVWLADLSLCAVHLKSKATDLWSLTNSIEKGDTLLCS
jgi:hypothetical protein